MTLTLSLIAPRTSSSPGSAKTGVPASEIKDKIISQVKLNIPTYNKDNLPKELQSIEAIKPGSRYL